MNQQMRSTTVLAVKHQKKIAMGGDGQVTMGDVVLKHNTSKIRLLAKGRVMAGFAGATADAFTLLEKFEGKLEEYQYDLARSSVELAKEWRQDKYLRRLEALLLVANHEKIFIITGEGDVVEPDKGVAAIGSGGPYAQSAALALMAHSRLSAKEIVQNSLEIAASLCIYTNSNITVEEL